MKLYFFIKVQHNGDIDLGQAVILIADEIDAQTSEQRTAMRIVKQIYSIQIDMQCVKMVMNESGFWNKW